MSARTAARHTADELTYHGIRGEYAVFSAKSASKPGKHNVIVRDVVTGHFHCDCTGAECGRRCWHADLLETAWMMREVAPFVAALADDELAATAVAAKARHEAVGGTRTDLLVYLQCRAEWRQRGAAAAARAVVAEWESLSYSDRHIDQHFDGRRGEREYDAARASLARLETIAA